MLLERTRAARRQIKAAAIEKANETASDLTELGYQQKHYKQPEQSQIKQQIN